MFNMQMEGGRDIERALFELKTTTAKSQARRMLKRAGQPVADTANNLAPKDGGDLAESVVVGTRLSKSQAAQERRAGRDDVFMYIGTDNPAAVQQEFGNQNHAAQPFMRPAWDVNKQGVLDQISKDFMADVLKAVERARRKAARKT